MAKKKLRKELEVFVDEMETVLRENDSDSNGVNYADDSLEVLIGLLEDKMRAMRIFLSRGENADIGKTAVDVANYAMMISDKTRNENTDEDVESEIDLEIEEVVEEVKREKPRDRKGGFKK